MRPSNGSLWRLMGCLMMCLAAMPAHAGIAVSPLKQEVTVKPGEPARFKVTLSYNRRGERDTAQSVRLEVMDVAVSEEGSLTFGECGSRKDSAGKWITLGATEVTLEPGQWRAVECTIKAPYSAAGEYYSAIMATLGTRDRNEKGVSVSYRVASGVFVTVAGRSFPRQAKIARCDVVWPQADQPGPAKIAVVLQNTGQARFDAGGKVAIIDSESRRVFTGPLTSARPCVFGGDSRRFEAVLNRPLVPGPYVVKVEMDYQSGWSKAYHSAPLEITPEHAELLKTTPKMAGKDLLSPVQPMTPTVSAAIPRGAFRSLKLTLKNNAEEAVQCTASLATETDGRINGPKVSLGPERFSVSRTGQRTLELIVHAPAGVAPGRYAYTAIVDVGVDGADTTQIKVPVELDVKEE